LHLPAAAQEIDKKIHTPPYGGRPPRGPYPGLYRVAGGRGGGRGAGGRGLTIILGVRTAPRTPRDSMRGRAKKQQKPHSTAPYRLPSTIRAIAVGAARTPDTTTALQSNAAVFKTRTSAIAPRDRAMRPVS